MSRYVHNKLVLYPIPYLNAFNLQIYLIQNGKRIKKKKTSITKSDDPTNPIWNEAFTFNLQSNYLQNAAIEVSESTL